MREALGLIEIRGLSTAVVVADTMAKAANVRILEVENTRGLGYMTIKIAGDVGAVHAAVNAGKQIGQITGKLISWKVIPRPSEYVGEVFCRPESAGTPGDEKAKEALEEKEESIEEKKEDAPPQVLASAAPEAEALPPKEAGEREPSLEEAPDQTGEEEELEEKAKEEAPEEAPKGKRNSKRGGKAKTS